MWQFAEATGDCMCVVSLCLSSCVQSPCNR